MTPLVCSSRGSTGTYSGKTGAGGSFFSSGDAIWSFLGWGEAVGEVVRDELEADLTALELLLDEALLRVILGLTTTSWGWLELPCLMGIRVTTGPRERWRVEEDVERFFLSFSGLALREEQSWCLEDPQRRQAGAAILWSWAWDWLSRW